MTDYASLFDRQNAQYERIKYEKAIRKDERRKVWLESAEMAEGTAMQINLGGTKLETLVANSMRVFASRLRAKAEQEE